LYFGTVTLLCAYVLLTSWTLGRTIGVYGLSAMVALMLGVLVVVARIAFAIGQITWSRGAVLRLCAGPVLIVVAVLLFFSGAPEKLRLTLSEGALDDFARTVTATSCAEESFRPRRVGLYTVTCAERRNGGVVLQVSDRLTPPRTGLWTLSGPGPWELSVED
jgi:hypothetical protein